MNSHHQVWVKVNAPVDADVAELVAVLNTVPGLETLQSCHGDVGGRAAYVYFTCGDWRQMCKFVFETIGPTLKSRLDEDARLSVQAVSADAPIAQLSFKAEATSVVVSALKEALRYDPPYD